jgi:hypothetical protein
MLKADGTVSYDTARLEGVLTGLGTSTLTVHGAPITIYDIDLSVPELVLDNTVVVTNTAPLAFAGLPGTYQLVDPTSAAAMSFMLSPGGTVDYDHSFDNILSGRGTSTLTVHLSTDIVLSGTAGSDTLTVTRTPGTGEGSITYVLNGGAPVALTNITSFKFLGMGGDDSMTVSLAGGAPLVAGNVFFDGGTGLNTLSVDAAGMPVRTTPGTLSVGGQSVGYTAVGMTSLNNAAGVNASAGPDTQDRAAAFAGLTAAERAVQALYLDALGRAGAPAELDGWVALLPAGATSLSHAVVSDIENSAEACDHLVRSWYLSYLGRPAINSEEQPFVQLLTSGQSEEQVLSKLLGLNEFYARAQTVIGSGTPDERFVQALMLDLWNRVGSPADIATLVSLLPQFGRAGLALKLLQTPEFRTNQFEGYYNVLLHRPEADAASLTALVASGMDMRTVRFIFETSAEFFDHG